MAKLGIYTGSAPDAGDGDSLLVGAIKINSNFSEIYNAIGNGTTITNSIGYASTSGISTTSQGLTGTPNIVVGVITASTLSVGVAGSVIFTKDESVGIGTTNPTSKLTVSGNVLVSGVTTSSKFVGIGSGLTDIDATNITLGTLDNSRLPASILVSNVTAAYFYGSGENLSGILTSGNLVGYATEGYVTNSLVGYATEGYVTNSLVGYATEGYVNNAIVGFITSGALSGYATEGYVNNAVVGFITSGALSGYATEGYVNNAIQPSYWISTAAGIHTLSNVGIGTTNPTSALTVKGNTSLETLNVSGVSTFNGRINAGTGGILFDTGSYSGSDEPIKLWIGNSGGARYFTLTRSNGGQVIFNNEHPTGQNDHRAPTHSFTQTGSEYYALFNNGSVKLYHPASSSGILDQKFETLGAGVTVTGTTFTNQLSVSGITTIGTGVTIYGSTGIVSATAFYGDVVGNITGSITDATNLTGGTANASSLNVSGIATISAGRIQADASSNLRFGNLPAGSGSGRNIAIGDQVLVSLSGGSGRNIGIGELSYYDTTTGQYNIGIGERAGQKVSTGSYNVILGAYDGNSGNLDIRTLSNNVVIADGQGNIRQYINSSGNVGIKTTVVTEALTVAGVVSATSFYGTLNAGQLTGSLPAIDGSALIGVISSGSGVVIEDDATPVGTAGTINFGSNISVSFASGIATVSGSGLATYANVAGIATYATTSGVSTTSGTATYAITAGVSTTSGTAGYATTAGISSAVSGTININTTGIITASSFSGSGANLTNLPAGQLTGSLPAIDGSALLNVTAAGTGVVVEDDTVNVGSATTINFGTGLDVTFSSGIATITSSGGSLQSRTTVTGVTTSIANNGIGNTNITGFKSYALMKVGLSTAGWLRLYTDSTSRANDVFRSVGEDPVPGSGVIAEVVTTGISTTQIISPFVMGGNLNNPADTTIYAAITNLSGSTQAITANLTILQLEA